MNPHLKDLKLYPFERLDQLKTGLVSHSNHPHISLALGEPKHDAPEFVIDALRDTERVIRGLSSYPATRGIPALREAIATWLETRYAIAVDPESEVLPVSGTREGLFSFGQAMLSGNRDCYTVMPNPFYQIYEGAALLRGSTPYYIPSTEKPNFQQVPAEIWDRTELVYICSPGNPSGHVISTEDLTFLIEEAQHRNFVIVADECYSEIYYAESDPPPGLLAAAHRAGVKDYKQCVSFNSLSKRSNLPGLRSGFIAGDRELISSYYDYRTYHGCAMPLHAQEVSSIAWQDESHVTANRAIYRAKFDAVRPLLAEVLNITQPEGAFYFWPQLPLDDETLTRQLFVEENITVLPGSYLGRKFQGVNPGRNRVRIALVAPLTQCVDAVARLCEALKRLTP